MKFSDWLNKLAYSFIGPIFTLIIVIAILFHKSPWLGLIALSVVLVSYLEFDRTKKFARPLNKKWSEYGEISQGISYETVSNMSTIATSSHVGLFQKKYHDAQSNTIGYALKTRRKWNNSMFRKTVFNEVAYLGAIGVSVWLAFTGKATPGDLLALTAYFSIVRSNAAAFAQFIPLTDEADVSAERLLEVLSEEPTVREDVDAVPLKSLQSIEFRSVSFAYPGSKKGAIENISFRIVGDQSTALVGPSGVGKSTITKLLLRFYDPTEGEVLINDQPIQSFTIDSLRSQIGMVMQDVALFNTTVKENLQLASPKATMAAIELAAEQAHASEFIEELPKQYNTKVGERGVKLSGGQKQRIAIARAILKNPQFIILDEATSALDSQSEQLVQEGLNRLRKGRSSLTIAHRLSTVQHADEILVLKSGKIHERGTHAELIKKPRGLYKKLFELQSATGKISL